MWLAPPPLAALVQVRGWGGLCRQRANAVVVAIFFVARLAGDVGDAANLHVLDIAAPFTVALSPVLVIGE